MFAHGKKERIRKEFEQVALPHLDALYGTALRLTHNERDAEDLVQDTVLRGFRFFHRFERGTNAKAWLFKILTNVFANRYRKRQRERAVLEEVEAAESVSLFSEKQQAQSRDPESALIGRLLSDHVKEALRGLPEDFRLAVILADLEDFSYREIADVMECPVGTVMSRIYRGRRLLQRRLAHLAGEQAPAEPDGQGAEAGAPRPAAPLPPHLTIVKTDS